MTELERLLLKLSETRSKLNDLAALETLDDAQAENMTTLTGEYQDLERRHRALIVLNSAEPAGTNDGETEGDTEGDTLAALIAASSVHEIVASRVAQRSTSGPVAELQKELGLNTDQIPLELLEIRAATPTPGPTDGEATSQHFVPAIFPRSVAAFLGVEQPTVPSGITAYHVLSTDLTVNLPAAGAAGANTAGAFASSTLEPKRIQGAFVLRREDTARLGPMLESALRENMGLALSTALDKEIVNGAADGLGQITNANAPLSANEDLYADYVGYVAAAIDGKYAEDIAQLRLLVGITTYQEMLGAYRGANDNTTALEKIRQLGAGVQATSHIAAVSSNVQRWYIARATGATHMVQPVWQGPTVITDEYTRADEGEIVVTLVGLFNQKIVRSAGFVARRVFPG